MKKGILLFLSVLLCFGSAACADRQAAASVPESSSRPAQPDTQSGSAASEAASADSQTAESSADNAEAGGKKAKLTINEQEFAVTLYDTPAANALYELLPLELTFADFNGIEKIAVGLVDTDHRIGESQRVFRLHSLLQLGAEVMKTRRNMFLHDIRFSHGSVSKFFAIISKI